MALTLEQRSTLAADIINSTDPAVVAARANPRNDTELTRLYNLPSASYIWRSLVTQDEIMQNGFDWVRVDNLSIGKARIWEWLFQNQSRSIDARKPNVRAGIAECWKGTAADLAVQAAVLAHCKRPALRAEALFLTGAGTQNDPAIAAFEGQITTSDMGQALNEAGVPG